MTSAPVIDLKYFQTVRHPSGNTRKEMTHVHRQTDIFTSHGLYAHSHISPLRRSLSRRPQCPKLYMPRPISLYGLCSIDIPGEPPRYRSLSSCPTAEVVPHGHSRLSSKVKSRRRQRTAGLANICRPCPFIDCHGANTLQQRTIIDLQQTVYALDATTIDLCLSMFPWAPFRQSKAAIKLHTLLDLRGNIPTFIYISDAEEYILIRSTVQPASGTIRRSC